MLKTLLNASKKSEKTGNNKLAFRPRFAQVFGLGATYLCQYEYTIFFSDAKVHGEAQTLSHWH